MAKPAITVEGLEDVKRMLDDLAPRHARNLMRATIHGVASQAAKEIKQRAPSDEGILKKNIKAKRRRSPPDAPVSDVHIGPDAFYWRFIENGTSQGHPEQPFVRPVADKIRAEFKETIRKQFGIKLEKKLKALAKKQAKQRAA